MNAPKSPVEIQTSSSSLTTKFRDQYQVLGFLGQGAYGIVLKVQDRQSLKLYAAKVMQISFNEKYGMPGTQMIELAVMKELHHKNVMNIIKIDYEAPRLVIIMELAKTDLASIIEKTWSSTLFEDQERSKTISEMIHITHGIFCGLAYIHANDIIHLDLKPENILLDELGEPLITDFGISQFDQGKKSREWDLVTWPYRAPEIQCKSGKYHYSADLWSMGVILCQIFFMRNPIFKIGYDKEDQMFSDLARRLPGLTDQWFNEYGNGAKSSICPIPKNVNRERTLNDVINFILEPFEVDEYRKIYGALFEPILDLIDLCLMYNPQTRITAQQALEHPLFSDIKLCNCETCLVNRGYVIDRTKNLAFLPDLRPVLDLQTNVGDFASEIFTRYKKMNELTQVKLPYTDLQLQTASLTIAAKLLKYIINRQAYAQHANLSLHVLNILELIVGFTVNWNFVGPMSG